MSKHDINTQEKFRKQSGCGKGLTVHVKQNADGTSDINSAIKQLKKRLTQEGMSKELRAKEYHVTKGEKRRYKKAEATRRYKRALRDQSN